MKYKLVDVSYVEEEYWFDTNTIEGYLTSTLFDDLIFVDELGVEHSALNGYISYSDAFEIWDIENYVEFASVIQGKDYPEVDEKGKSMEDIVDLMYRDYQNHVYEEGEE